MKQLFRGHKELILGFNTFLPQVRALSVSKLDTSRRPTPLFVLTGGSSLSKFALQGYEITVEEVEEDEKVCLSASLNPACI